MNLLVKSRSRVVGASLVVVLFAILSLRDQENATFTGLSTDATRVVTRVRPGSPAQAAGFEVGDKIVREGGVDVTRTQARARQPRPEIGEHRDFEVEREGVVTTLTMIYSGLPGKQRMIQGVRWLTGVCFLLFSVGPFLKLPNPKTGLLATFGLSLGVLFVGTPYIPAYALRTAVSAIVIPLVLYGLASLLHLMLLIPHRSTWLDREIAGRVMYWPAALMGLYTVFLILVRPESTEVLARFSRIAFGVFIVGYFGISLVLAIRRYVRSSTTERVAHGQHVLLAGMMLALLPSVVSTTILLFAPRAVLPGSDFYGLTYVLLPLSLAYSVAKSSQAAT